MVLKLSAILLIVICSDLSAKSQASNINNWIGKYQFSNDSVANSIKQLIIIDVRKYDRDLLYRLSETFGEKERVFSGFCKIKNNSLQLFFSKMEKGKFEYRIIDKSKPYYRLYNDDDGNFICVRLQPDIAEIANIFKRIE
jgi:hypothetical protein